MEGIPAQILVVDDDVDQRNDLAEMVTSFGYEVTTAADGREALEKLEVATFSAILSDLMMPRIDGFTLDLIIDYVACVIVPACFMYEFKVVPQNNFGIAVLCVLVATSAIWFARRDMMSEDNWFRGFPAAWNLVAPVMFLMEARTAIGADARHSCCDQMLPIHQVEPCQADALTVIEAKASLTG